MKPVACIVDDELYFADEIDWEELKGIPLYTAPRELSDEEINSIWHGMIKKGLAIDIIEFARELLKKASEK